MKQLADISSFESLVTTNCSTAVANSYTTRRVRNNIFSKGTEGDIDRALLKKRGMALLKEGAGILAQLGIRGATVASIAEGAAVEAVTRMPKAIHDSLMGSGSGLPGLRMADHIADIGRRANTLIQLPKNALEGVAALLRASAENDQKDIKRLRDIKMKGQ